MLTQTSLFEDDREREKRSRIYGTPEFRYAYHQYLRSPAWRRLCKLVKERSKGRCERCSKKPSPFTVHHKTYERFMNELLTDLEGLCKSCHDLADAERQMENHHKYLQAGEAAKRDKARDTYLEKKYGEDWYLYYHADPEGLESEFGDWLDSKQGEEFY